MNIEQVWETALKQLETQMTKPTFEAWVKTTYIISYENNNLVIGAKNQAAKDWLENRLRSTIYRTLTSLLGGDVAIEFLIDAANNPENQNILPLQPSLLLLDNPIPPDSPATQTPPSSPVAKTTPNAQLVYSRDEKYPLLLSPNYTFEQFVVGPSNRLAHAASLAVAEYPGKAYNPLFLYGGVGLGKTHLLQAVAHYALSHDKRVIYTTSEAFTNDLIDSIRSHATEAFREKYRGADFLLIDDIQFIAGKESTQEELFHTFNTLHSSGSQVILSSDRPPKAIHTLEDRLLSRFEWGLLADLQPPALETRIAILRFKAETLKVQIPNDVVEFIARHAQNNIRELEGALNKVVAMGTTTQQPITMSLATNALQDIVTRESELTIPQIVTAVAKFYRIDPKVLLGRDRTKEIAIARQMIMYLAREETKASLPQIGDALGRDHTTIKHGWEKISSNIEEDDKLRREMLAIRELIYVDNQISFY